MLAVVPDDGDLPGLGARNSERTDADAIEMGDMKQKKNDESFVFFSLPAGIRQLMKTLVMSGSRCG